MDRVRGVLERLWQSRELSLPPELPLDSQSPSRSQPNGSSKASKGQK